MAALALRALSSNEDHRKETGGDDGRRNGPFGGAGNRGAAGAAGGAPAPRRCSACRACHLRSCSACREFYSNTADWLCSICHQLGELQGEFTRRPSRRRESRSLHPPEVSKRNVRRSWTISSANPRWSAPRGEVRAYSSLPRHRSVADYPSLAPRPRPYSDHDNPTHTDSGVGTQDEAEDSARKPSESLDIVKTMLEKAKEREEALRSVAQPVKGPDDRGLGSVPAGTGASLTSTGIRSRSSDGEGGEDSYEGEWQSSVLHTSRRAAARRRRHDSRRQGPMQEWGSACQRSRRSSRMGIVASEASAVIPPHNQCNVQSQVPEHTDPNKCLHEGDDLKLVFISSDSSSRDEDDDVHSDDSISTSSGSPGVTLDDCDWDYFEPAVASRLRSPALSRRPRGESPILCSDILGSPGLSRRVARARLHSELDGDLTNSEKETAVDSNLGSPNLTRRMLTSLRARESPTASLLGDFDLQDSPVLTRKKLYSTNGRNEFGVLGAGLDDYDDPRCCYSLPESPLSARQRPRIFVDGSPSSSDCSSSGYVVASRRRYLPDSWSMVESTSGKPTSDTSSDQVPSCGHKAQHSRRSSAGERLRMTCPSGGGSSTTGSEDRDRDRDRSVFCGPDTGAVELRTSTCASCVACGSLSVPLPIIVPIPVPVPVLVPVNHDAVDLNCSNQNTPGVQALIDGLQLSPLQQRLFSQLVATRHREEKERHEVDGQRTPGPGLPGSDPAQEVPAATPYVGAALDDKRASEAMRERGGGGGRRRNGGRGRHKQRVQQPSASPAPGDVIHKTLRNDTTMAQQEENPNLKNTIVAEDDDNGIVLVTFRHLKDEKQLDQVDHTIAPATSADDEPKTSEPQPENDSDTEVKSSCASTSSSDDDTNVDFDSDSEDATISRTYCLKDGKTKTREVVEPGEEDTLRLKQDSTAEKSLSSSAESSSDADEDSDTTRTFSRVFVINRQPQISEKAEEGHEGQCLVPLSSDAADSADSTNRWLPSARAASPPAPVPVPAPSVASAAPAAPLSVGDTSPDASVVRVDSTSEVSAVVPVVLGKSYADIARGGRTSSSAVHPPGPAPISQDATAFSAKDETADDHLEDISESADASANLTSVCHERDAQVDSTTTSGLSVQAETPAAGDCVTSVDPEMSVVDTSERDSRLSALAEDVKRNMFGEEDLGEKAIQDFGIAAVNEVVIESIAPGEFVNNNGNNCLSLIEYPVALKDIFKSNKQLENDEESKPEAEMERTSEGSSIEFEYGEQMKKNSDVEGEEFSGTESMELSPVCDSNSIGVPDTEFRTAEQLRAQESGEPEPEGPVTPLDCASESSTLASALERESPLQGQTVNREPPDEDVLAGAGVSSPAATAKYTSLVMITQEGKPQVPDLVSVSVVTNQAPVSPVTLLHTNLDDERPATDPAGLSGYFTLKLDGKANEAPVAPPRRPVVSRRNTPTPSASEAEDSSEDMVRVVTGEDRRNRRSAECSEDSGDGEEVKVVSGSDMVRVVTGEDRRPATLKRDSGSDAAKKSSEENEESEDEVKVVTGGDTLSAVICLEEGLADDDSWVEEIEQDRSAEVDEEFATTTATDTSSGDEGATDSTYLDREEELRGYHRAAIDFTLHTILEESCEESEVEQPNREDVNKTRPPSASDLEKYFFFGLGGGNTASSPRDVDTLSETNSSIYSEGLESLGTEDAEEGVEDDPTDPAELASSRLEKYFLSGFMGFPNNRRDSDGSVGSDSEGRPSPEQRRKRLVRARGTGRAHSNSNSLDNLATDPAETPGHDEQLDSEGSSSSTETDVHEEPALALDGQFDTVKRKKRKRSVGSCSSPAVLQELEAKKTSSTELLAAAGSSDERDGARTPQAEFVLPDLSATRNKQQSRDSGFVGSCDDLLRGDKAGSDSSASSGAGGEPRLHHDGEEESTSALKQISTVDEAENEIDVEAHPKPIVRASPSLCPQPQPVTSTSIPPATGLTRKDSFNNWSSDEETNLMMSKMRAFFKTMVGPVGQHSAPPAGPQPVQTGPRKKPPQLLYFESELTRLMKTVPGIRDEQVRELVEYLSSEDTWSDSYDSSDYTSSDLEGATSQRKKSALQEQISASCQQIISNFDTNATGTTSPVVGENPGARDTGTALVYQRLVASLSKMGEGCASSNSNSPAAGSNSSAATGATPPHSSPPIFAKVMQHIGVRLVALMHEVSSGECSPRARYTHRRLQQKISSTSTTTEEDEDSVTDTESDSNQRMATTVSADLVGGGLLARSRSHDLLGSSHGPGAPHGKDSLLSSSSGMSDLAAEEREASDYERFSWRGSFESALMATDSRTRLSVLSGDGPVSSSSSALAMAAKRRSAGDLLFAHKSLSREQLDRVRSCGSIGGAGGAMGSGCGGGSTEGRDLLWGRDSGRRASVPDANTSGGSADGDDDDDDDLNDCDMTSARSTTLPRSLQTSCGAGTNSLPRLPTSGSAAMSMLKAHSLAHVQSARYRPPGYSRLPPPQGINTSTSSGGPKRAVSAPGLQQPVPAPHPRRDRRRPQMHLSLGDDGSLDAPSSPVVASYSATPSPVAGRAKRAGRGSTTSRGSALSAASNSASTSSGHEWTHEEDLENLVTIHHRPPQGTNMGPRSDSMVSVYSGAGEGRYGTVAVKGEVEFGLQYNYKQSALEIHVMQCRDLAPVDVKRNRSDPYVKVYLLPDKSKGGKRKTRVKKHTLNPFFDETLKFHISLKGLESRTLWLTVWHSDMFGRNDFLGEVMMSLENKVFDDPTPRFYPLQERTEPFDDLLSFKGDMIVALKFIPPDVSCNTLGKKAKRSSKGSLHVLVKEAKNLTAVKANGTSDPFCKSYLLPDKGRSSKQKTAVIRRTCSPAWNHTFVYSDVSLQELSERALELTVWDHDRLASNEFLGGVRLSLGTGKQYGKPVEWMDSTGKELTLWQRMLERPNLWVESCVTLRPSLERTANSSNSNMSSAS